MDIIKSLEIPLPVLAVQDRYVSLARRRDHLADVQAEAVRQARHLFEGELERRFAPLAA